MCKKGVVELAHSRPFKSEYAFIDLIVSTSNPVEEINLSLMKHNI